MKSIIHSTENNNFYLYDTVDDKIASWQSIEASQLIEDYEKGKLKGRLKEIAASLDEESNPVIMLIKHKKQTNP